MWNKLWVVILFSSFQFCNSQTTQTPEMVLDEPALDTLVRHKIDLKATVEGIYNSEAIENFYTKLKQLEENKDRKIRITHLGDSHIQADFFTGQVRTLLQDKFGNAGLGFSFPYSLAKTNGNYDIKFSSNANFERLKLTSADLASLMGLAGYQLKTQAKDFAIELNAKNADYAFTTIKLLSPNNAHLFDLATTSKEIKIESSKPKTITHKIKSGEALSIIAEKYNVSVAAIKRANGLKSNAIRAGKTLKIPTNQKEAAFVSRREFMPLDIMPEYKGYSYYSNDLLDKIYLIPAQNATDFELSGIILENDPGVIYNGIGVNGAKAIDFNKFPSFYDDLQVLDSDLIIISLGTNESFDKLDGATFFQEFDKMLTKIRNENPTVEILVTTPPPSLWKRSIPNTLAEEYTYMILTNAVSKGYAVWNLFDAMGGLKDINQNSVNGIIAKDKVHYTRTGYKTQGTLFYNALMQSYEQLQNPE